MIMYTPAIFWFTGRILLRPAFPLTLYRGFSPPKLILYPRNDEVPYMFIYPEGTEMNLNESRDQMYPIGDMGA